MASQLVYVASCPGADTSFVDTRALENTLYCILYLPEASNTEMSEMGTFQIVLC